MVTLVYPSQAFNNTSLISKQPTLFNQSPTGKSASRFDGGHQWRIEASHPGLFKSQHAQVDGFLEYVGKHTKFKVLLPDRATPRGVATGSPAVNNVGGYAEGVSSIAIDGCTASVTDWLMAADFFSFASHDKVYMNTSDVNTNGSGETTLTFEPPLKQAILDGDVLTVNNVSFVVVSVNNHGYSIGNDNLYNMDMTLMEAA